MAYDIKNTKVIYLGRQGENLARTIEIDVSSMLMKWPDATISLLVQRNQEDTFYLAPVVIENGILKWTITNADTEIAGIGKIEVRAIQDDAIMKSATMKICVENSLGGTETDVPDPVQTWVDTIVAASVQAKQSAEDALASELAAKEAAESITELESNIKTAEAARVEAEKERISAENERIDAEIARSNAETSRASAEQERQTAEGTRVSAETSRETAENNRVAAETARVTAEQSRASAETARENAETDRQTTFETNEAQRQAAFETAESARESAEAQRVTAEDARATEFAGFSGEITQLKDDLADKLPKSPANWEQWTAEEQAAARERMGIPGGYELIDTITIDEDSVLDFTFPYTCKNVLIIGKVNKIAAKQAYGYFKINRNVNYPAPFDGIPNTYTTNTVWSVEIMTNGSYITIINTRSDNVYLGGVQKSVRYLSEQSISSLQSIIEFLAGTELIVYGVRA